MATTYLFSTLVDNQHLVFDPDADTLAFDSADLTASAVRLLQSGANLSLSVGGKTVCRQPRSASRSGAWAAPTGWWATGP